MAGDEVRLAIPTAVQRTLGIDSSGSGRVPKGPRCVEVTEDGGRYGGRDEVSLTVLGIVGDAQTRPQLNSSGQLGSLGLVG